MKKIITLLALVFCLNANAQIITTVAGTGINGYTGDGGAATLAKIYHPASVTVDGFGNLFVTDSHNNVVRQVNSSGIISTIAGNGTQGFSGDGGLATSAQLYYPSGVACDTLGNLFIAEYNNNRIRVVNSVGIISTFAGNGIGGYNGDGGQATAAEINVPVTIVTDKSGNLYIADRSNNRIRKINTLGIITTVAGNGTAGYSGDGGYATSAELRLPCGVAIDSVGNLYIADQYNHCIRSVNSLGIINTVVGNGTAGYSGDGGSATLAQLNYPADVIIDALGNLYITDQVNNRIRLVNTSGIISTYAGSGIAGYSGDGGPAIAAQFNLPLGIRLDAFGNIYIADESNNCVRKITNPGLTTGTSKKINEVNQTQIYPNPTNNNFTIETLNTNKQTLQIFDVNGKLVLTQTIDGKTNIDATNLSEGVYNLSLINTNGVANKRLVIVR